MFFLENDYLLEEVEPTEMGLDGLEGAFILHAECDQMWYNLREKMMKLEHTAIMTEDEDLLSEGTNSFIENVKKIFRKMKEAVEELFRRFMEWVSRLFSNDKKLVERLKSLTGNVVAKVQGFPFTGLDEIGKKLTNARGILETATSKMSAYTGKKPAQAVAEILGLPKNKISTDSDLVNAMKEKMQGAKERKEITIKRADCASILAKAKENIAQAEKIKKSLQSALDLAVKTMDSGLKLDAAGDEFERRTKNQKDDKIKNANQKAGEKRTKRIEIAKEISRGLISAYGAWISVLKDQRSTHRAAASKMINGNGEKLKADSKKKKTTKKDEDVNNESFTGILGLF